jgi:TctA family transporter
LVPAVVGIELGPLAEPALRQSRLISSGDFFIFPSPPIAGMNMVIAVVLLLLPLYPVIKRCVVG